MQPLRAVTSSATSLSRDGQSLPGTAPAPRQGAPAALVAAALASPLNADAAVLAALDEVNTGQPHAALALLDAVWAAVSLDERAWVVRVGALLQMGRFVDASGVAARGLADLPRSLALRILFADAAQHLGEPELALRALHDAEEIAPNSALVHERIALVVGAPAQSAPVPLGAVLATVPPSASRVTLSPDPAQLVPPVMILGQELVRMIGSPDAAVTARGTLRFAGACAGLILVISGDRLLGAGLIVLALAWPFRWGPRRSVGTR